MALCGIESNRYHQSIFAFVTFIDYIYSVNSFYLNLFIRTSCPLPNVPNLYADGVNLAQNASSFILIDYGAISGVD